MHDLMKPEIITIAVLPATTVKRLIPRHTWTDPIIGWAFHRFYEIHLECCEKIAVATKRAELCAKKMSS